MAGRNDLRVHTNTSKTARAHYCDGRSLARGERSLVPRVRRRLLMVGDSTSQRRGRAAMGFLSNAIFPGARGDELPSRVGHGVPGLVADAISREA